MSETRDSHKPTIYTAGAIRSPTGRGEHLGWRRSVEANVPDVEFIHPDDAELTHGVGVISGCVSEDMNMLNQADGIVAYIQRDEQNGTLVEIMHAVGEGMPVLVVFEPGERPGSGDDTNPDVEAAADDDTPVARPVTPVEWNHETSFSDSHWFLINYLLGDPKGNWENRIRKDVSMSVPEWSGCPKGEVWMADSEGFNDIVRVWANQITTDTERDEAARWANDDLASHAPRGC